jgi:pimeloyl-ACP methyl ester carboxylesterase
VTRSIGGTESRSEVHVPPFNRFTFLPVLQLPRPLAPSELFPAGAANITSRFITLSTGLTVRVAESGPSDGKPAVMLHGWGGSLYMYRHGLERLPAFGVRTIAVDLRGYGLSDKPMTRGAYRLEEFLGDVDALLDALELRRASLIGQSMGGAIALRYAARRPERVSSLALINPVGLVPVVYPALLWPVPLRISRMLGRRVVPRALISFILRRIAYGDASNVTERDVDEYWAPTQLRGYVYAAHACLDEFEWTPLPVEDADAFQTPNLIILGTVDRMVRHAHDAAARLNGSNVRHIEGGHCVHEEQPALVYDLIGRHVR